MCPVERVMNIHCFNLQVLKLPHPQCLSLCSSLMKDVSTSHGVHASVIPEEVRRDQMYTVTLFVENLNTSEQTTAEVEQSNYYIFKIGRSCDLFNISVRANNGAGSSELSSNESMVLPSLPDIEPVSSSLQHQLWKENGRIMVKLSFEVH